jgi:hypothetical protein
MTLKPGEFYLEFQTRAYASRLPPSVRSIKPTGMSWSVYGGCKMATIKATGNEKQMYEFVEYLRCPVEVFDYRAKSTWWGYVANVTINSGISSYTVSLDQMANKVAVSFVDTEASGTVNEEQSRSYTVYSNNAESVNEYGQKWFLYDAGKMRHGGAGALRDRITTQRAYPPAKLEFQGGRRDNEFTAEIQCRGWFDTIGWAYYVGTTYVLETTAQLRHIGTIATTGQFITAVQLDTNSGVTSHAMRDGSSTGLQEAMELMQYGGTNTLRIFAEVDNARRLRYYAESAVPSTFQYTINKLGQVTNQVGKPYKPWDIPVGVWAQARDVIPASADVTRIADATKIHIDEISWREGSEIPTILAKEQAGPLDILRIMGYEAPPTYP